MQRQAAKRLPLARPGEVSRRPTRGSLRHSRACEFSRVLSDGKDLRRRTVSQVMVVIGRDHVNESPQRRVQQGHGTQAR